MTAMVARLDVDWCGTPPDWVVALAGACDQASQSAVAKRCGYSPSTVNQVLRNRYAGDLGAVEAAVRGALMAHVVACPVLGEVPSHQCIAHQRRKPAQIGANPTWVRLYRACPTCPNHA